MGGMLLGLVLFFVIGVTFGKPIENLVWKMDLYETVYRVGKWATTAVAVADIVTFLMLGTILGAIFPKFFAWAWHLIPKGDHG